MAATGATPISLYYSATATNVPTAGNLVAGELAINTADGKLFYKDSSGVVQTIASKAGNLNVSSFSGGTTGLTPNTATTGVVTLAGTLAVANGGTGGTTSTGSGAVVLATSPTVTTPTIDKINTSVANTSLGAGNASIMKNRIINGAMVISQRGTSFTPSDQDYTLDRWKARLSAASKYTVAQSSTAPSGYINSLLVTSSSAYTVGASDYFFMEQDIEGLNFYDLGWGTANAKTITLSFQVYSSLTGTFGGCLQNQGQNRSYPFTYTVSSANTWTTISVIIAGDTTGTWLTTNGIGLRVMFGLGVGSSLTGAAGSWAGSAYYGANGAVNVVSTNGATWYITGVQLEVGSSATGFEYRQYQQELALCQRYYEMSYDIGTVPATATNIGSTVTALNGTATAGYIGGQALHKVTKRATPTVTIYDPAGASGKCQRSTPGVGSNNGQTVSTDNVGLSGFNIVSSSGTLNQAVYAQWTSSSEL